MTLRAVAIGLKIPDNAAYTALVTLQRLGVEVERVERTDVVCFDDDGSDASVRARVEADEALYNPNKHRVTVLGAARPRAGEVWIEPLDEAAGDVRRYTGWRLFSHAGAPADPQTVDAAVERLLCNPAIERALR